MGHNNRHINLTVFAINGFIGSVSINIIELKESYRETETKQLTNVSGSGPCWDNFVFGPTSQYSQKQNIDKYNLLSCIACFISGSLDWINIYNKYYWVNRKL